MFLNIFGRKCSYRISIMLVLLVMVGLFSIGTVMGAEKPAEPPPPVEKLSALDYKGIYENMSRDLTQEKDTLALEIEQWKIYRENIAKFDLKNKEYRVVISSFAKSLISGNRDLKKLETDLNFLKPMSSELDEPVRQVQKRIQAFGEDLSRVNEKLSLNLAYSNEVMTAVDTSNSEAARLKKNFKELERIHERRKQTITELLDTYQKSLVEMSSVKKDFQTLSEKYAQELINRKKEVLFEKGKSPLGSISFVEMTREIISLFPKTVQVLQDYVQGEKGAGVIAINLVVFAFLTALMLFMLVRLRSFWDDQVEKGRFGARKSVENICALTRRSMILGGLAVYFFIYGFMVQAVMFKACLTLFVRLIMAFLVIDWLLFFMERMGQTREIIGPMVEPMPDSIPDPMADPMADLIIDPRRLVFWNLFLKGLFPILGVNLFFDLIYVYNHMIPIFLRLVLGLYLLAGFFVMTFRLKFSTGAEKPARRWILKIIVGAGNLIFLAGLLMELLGYGALSIYWYISWICSVAIFIWSWHFFFLLMDLRVKQKDQVTRDPYFSQVLSHGHPVKWFFLQVGWVACFVTTIVLMVLAWSRDWGVVVSMFTFLNHPFIVGSLTFSIMNLFYAALTVGATHVATRLWKHLLLRKILVDSGFEDSIQNSISMITVYTMWLFGILLALHVFGLGTTSLTVAFGALGIGLGFGLQNIFNNFISGIILLFERPIQVGDDIEINGTWANVRKINVRSTIVQTYDNASLIIPNSDFISAQVTNWTLKDKRIRRRINVGVTYGSDIHLVRECLLEIARSNTKALAFPKPDVLFADFGANSLDFVLRLWTNVDLMLQVDTEIRFEIDRIFREKGIVIAFPQLDVHLDHQG